MNDHFTMRCPKCSSTGLERFQDRATSWGGLDDFALKCRTCGKVLYGEDTCQAEWDRQYAEWKKSAPDRAAAIAAAEAKAKADAEFERQMVETERKRRETARRAAEEARKKKEAENRAWALQAAQRREESAAEPAGDTCAWKDCDAKARPNSIYCSRGCSNKNARWRYKMRSQEDSQAA